MKRFVKTPPSIYPWLVSGLTLAADQLTKFLISKSFAPGESRPILFPIIHLTYVQNTGAAFGLFKGCQMLFIAVSLVVIAWVVLELIRRPPFGGALISWGCALILGGSIGNLIDRFRFGYVVDFIDLRVWPVFNIGDSAITVGVALLMLYQFPQLRHFRPTDRRNRRTDGIDGPTE